MNTRGRWLQSPMPLPTVAAVLAIAALATSCGQAKRAPADAPLQTSAPPAQTAAPAQATRPKTEAEELAERIAEVTPEARAAYEARRAALWKRYEQAAPSPRVLFEVPLREETSECLDQAKSCAVSRALYYGHPEKWGLGPLAVSDDGVLWVADAAIGRAAGFDRAGRLVHGFFSDASGRYELMAVGGEIWFESWVSEAPWLVRHDRSGQLLGSYDERTIRGPENRVGGRVVSRNPLRVVQHAYTEHWKVSDVSFEDGRAVFGPPRPIVVAGQRYALDCDKQGKRPATFVIGEHAVPAPGCLLPYWFGANGDFIAGPPFYRFDASGEPVAIAMAPDHEDRSLFSEGRNYGVGPDGKLYAYVVRKRSVRFVEVPFFPAK